MESSTLLEPFMRLYGLTGEKRYLAFARYLVDCGGAKGSDLVQMAFDRVPPHLMGGVYPKAYETTSYFEGLADYWRATGDGRVRRAVLNYFELVRDRELTIVGNGGADQPFHPRVCGEAWSDTAREQTNPDIRRMMETCTGVTWMKFCSHVLRMTGDCSAAEAMETYIYNGLVGAMKSDGRGFSYVNLLNGEKVTNSGWGWEFGGKRVTCCNLNGPMGLAYIPYVAAMQSADGVVLNLYNAMTAKAKTPSGAEVEISLATDYPLSGNVRVEVSPAASEEFAIRMRIPAWSASTGVKVNGAVWDGSPAAGKYLEVRRVWRAGDVVELAFDMRCRLLKGPHGVNRAGDNTVAVKYGPVVLTRDEDIDKEYGKPVRIAASDSGIVQARRVTPPPGRARIAFAVPTSDGSIVMTDYASADSWDGSRICTWLPCVAAQSEGSMLPVIPQPAEWKQAQGECDLAKAKVSAKVDKEAGLGEEGYTMSIAPDSIRIVAGGDVGAVWARQTLAQLRAHGGAAPCGEIRDMPKYRVRGFMLDVGRMYHSMEFLYGLARTMSYYKLNTLHIHLNDSGIVSSKEAKPIDWSRKYAAFRMECETYPELTAKDGHYTKREFRAFMLFCRSIGVTVIPEFDTPAHALAFTRVRPDFASKKYGADHFDLGKSEEILAWLKPLFAEYLTGDEPTFIGPYMHVGTDEYNKDDAEKFRAFTDSMLKMVIDFGYRPCAWGSLTHAKGKAAIRAGRDITMDIWNNSFYRPEEALKDGYTIVSVPDRFVYIVPFAGYYRDYLDCRKLYMEWEPRMVAGYSVPDEYMGQLAGGKFALWNDCEGRKKDGTPYTELDNWDRIHPAIQTLSQKFWRGAEGNTPWEFFAALADSLSEPEGVAFTHKVKLTEQR